MSQQNSRIAKQQRSTARAARKSAAARTIRHHGVWVDRKLVESQRQLHRCGLPFSARVAAVAIPGRSRRAVL